MGMFDYSNLKNTGAAAKVNVSSGGWNPLTEGEWDAKFMGAERTMTQGRGGKPKRPMIVTEWRINAKGDERMHRETLKIRYIMDIEFHAERYLSLMIDLGLDLGMIDCDEDWDEVFDELLESNAKAKWKVYYNDTDKEKNEDGELVVKRGSYPEYRLVGVIQGLDDGCGFRDANHEPSTVAKNADTPAKPATKSDGSGEEEGAEAVKSKRKRRPKKTADEPADNDNSEGDNESNKEDVRADSSTNSGAPEGDGEDDPWD